MLQRSGSGMQFVHLWARSVSPPRAEANVPRTCTPCVVVACTAMIACHVTLMNSVTRQLIQGFAVV
jgi:hypothetical protein